MPKVWKGRGLVGLKPCDQLEHVLKKIDWAFSLQAKIPYWIHFGGLLAIVKKDGYIPDGDIDICTYYENNHKARQIIKLFCSQGFRLKKVLLNDTNINEMLYCGFDWSKPQTPEQYLSEKFYPHICLSFWYPHNGIRYYCHDEKNDIAIGGEGPPKSGYYFKGFPGEYTQEMYLKKVEWPGISPKTKISVPLFPCLSKMYPGWAYNEQRYNITRSHEVIPEKMRDLWRETAISEHMVHIKSMADWNNQDLINKELAAGKLVWDKKVEELRKAR